MEDHVENGRRPSIGKWRIAGWSVAAGMLLLPLVAMQFTDEVHWDGVDFAVFGMMLLGVGVTIEFAARRTGNTAHKTAYRAGIVIAVVAAFLLFWANGAVGIIGSENNDANQIFNVVLAIGLIGALLARFEPKGMARAMYATAGAQALAFVIALVAGWGFTRPITVVFVALWLGSATMFRRAATVESQSTAAPAG